MGITDTSTKPLKLRAFFRSHAVAWLSQQLFVSKMSHVKGCSVLTAERKTVVCNSPLKIFKNTPPHPPRKRQELAQELLILLSSFIYLESICFAF